MEYNGNMYYYQYNLQGDVTGLYDSNFNLVTTYLYDAYGFNYDVNGTMAETIGTINPFRYRGYYLDEETGFYYLNSRYYDPETGRFINVDDTAILLEDQGNLVENNLFAYCLNNPINFIDIDGKMAAVATMTSFAAFGFTSTATSMSITAISTTIITALGAITPVGWIVIGATAVVTVATISVVYAKTKDKSVVDPYARPGQKKQGRELKNKSRRKDNFQPRNNKRSGKPATPKHHTPGKDHQKYNRSLNAKVNLMHKLIG